MMRFKPNAHAGYVWNYVWNARGTLDNAPRGQRLQKGFHFAWREATHPGQDVHLSL